MSFISFISIVLIFLITYVSQFIVFRMWTVKYEKEEIESRARELELLLNNNDSNDIHEKIVDSMDINAIIYNSNNEILLNTMDKIPKDFKYKKPSSAKSDVIFDMDDDKINLISPINIKNNNYYMYIEKESDLFGDFLESTIPIIIIMLIVGLIISLIAGMYISKQFIKKLNNLSNTMKKIQEKGISNRVAIQNPNDDFDKVNIIFNDMMDSVENSFEVQKQFVQDASHELRTPLTIIFSKVESIIKRPKNKVEDEMNNLVIVMKEVRRLSKLVSDLLKLTKEDAIITINKSKFDIVEMINDILKQYEDIFELQNKKLKVNYTLKDNNIYSDKEKLKQIFIIIIDNAMKYTKENDYIQVCLSEEGSNVKIEVKDSGIGIKEEEISLIFNRFYRASSHRETNKEGSGIGLSIAKLLVSNLKGELCVNSKYKKGSTFSIYIPKK